MTSSAIVRRLFALTGAPAPSGALARALARCRRERLTRAVAWVAWESRLGLATASCLTGVRLLGRGWGDVYAATTLPSGAERVDLEAPGDGRALVTRHAREGRGWQKEPISSIGEVRQEIELAVRWLAIVAGCIVHEDCAAHPELGAACAASL